MSSQHTDEEICRERERERADEAQRRLEEDTRRENDRIREKQREIEQTLLLMTLIDN